MRKLHISIGMALLLLTAQMGAVLHEVSHMSRVGIHARERLNTNTYLQKTCDLCIAFSQVANPSANTVAVAHFEPSSCAAGSIAACAVTPTDVPAPRSRGPPTFRTPILTVQHLGSGLTTA